MLVRQKKHRRSTRRARPGGYPIDSSATPRENSQIPVRRGEPGKTALLDLHVEGRRARRSCELKTVRAIRVSVTNFSCKQNIRGGLLWRFATSHWGVCLEVVPTITFAIKGRQPKKD